MSFIKYEKVPDGHKMASFDVVALDTTTEIILKRKYHNKVQLKSS